MLQNNEKNNMNNSMAADARFRIVPVPYEGTVCFLGGTAKGPEAILGVFD